MIHKIFRIKVGSILKQIKKKQKKQQVLRSENIKTFGLKLDTIQKIVGNIKASETR